jgi:L-seryl-tRNA(Ser) seleniumtransferase
VAEKTSGIRDRLPSVSDLLENPSIRALANRLNKSAVVTGVRSFLDELRSDMSRRGAESSWPSLRELAERAARHIAATQMVSQRPAVNATGRIWGLPWVARPQASEALEQAFAAGTSFVAGGAANSPSGGDPEELICRLTGAGAAAVVHSYAGALWLTMSALVGGKELVVSRGEVGDVDFGCSLAALATSAGARLREVGAMNRTSAPDYEEALGGDTGAILRVRAAGYGVVGETHVANFEELVALARDRELPLIDALGEAPLVDTSAQVPWCGQSMRSSIERGASLAILHGDGLLGGPPCGILAGETDLVRRITSRPMFAAWRLDVGRSAALAATLRSLAYSDANCAPIVELLTTPLDNLRNRAERLSQQLKLAKGVSTADVIATLSYLDGVPIPDRSLASFGVAVSAADGDLASLERRLSAAVVPVLGRREGDRLILDLRTVFPRQDQDIVAALFSSDSLQRAAKETSGAAPAERTGTASPS